MPQIETMTLSLRVFLLWCIYFIMFAGLAGYFASFWPGKRPIRRILWTVCLPLSLGLALILRKFFQLSHPTSSVLYFKSDPLAFPAWLFANALKLPPGAMFSMLGLVLILIFGYRLVLGYSSLPVKLPNQNRIETIPVSYWNNVLTLILC